MDDVGKALDNSFTEDWKKTHAWDYACRFCERKIGGSAHDHLGGKRHRSVLIQRIEKFDQLEKAFLRLQEGVEQSGEGQRGASNWSPKTSSRC